MKENIQYVLVWNGWLRICHWALAVGVLFQLFSAFALSHQHIDYAFWFDWHQIIGQSLLLVLGLRIILSFQPGSGHWRSFMPNRAKLNGMLQMLKFYISMARGPLPNWYAHNPLWQPLYLIIVLVLIAACITGMLQDQYAQLHSSLAMIISLFTLFHVVTAFVHDWKGKGGMISAMVNGYRYFHNDNPVQNSVSQGTEYRIPLTSITRKKPDPDQPSQ